MPLRSGGWSPGAEALLHQQPGREGLQAAPAPPTGTPGTRQGEGPQPGEARLGSWEESRRGRPPDTPSASLTIPAAAQYTGGGW